MHNHLPQSKCILNVAEIFMHNMNEQFLAHFSSFDLLWHWSPIILFLCSSRIHSSLMHTSLLFNAFFSTFKCDWNKELLGAYFKNLGFRISNNSLHQFNCLTGLSLPSSSLLLLLVSSTHISIVLCISIKNK